MADDEQPAERTCGAYDEQSPEWPRSAEVGAVAVDHARLAYAYLDDDDLDAYASLCEEDVVLRRPGETISGRAELADFHKARVGRCRYSVTEVIPAGTGKHVVVLGRVREPGHDTEVGFADVFAVSGRGLFVSQQTYFFVTPAR